MKNFTDEVVKPIHPDAKELVDCLEELLWSKEMLKLAKTSVPSYTGQWDSEDYYKDEQERFNIAANKFHDMIRRISACTNGDWG